MRHPGLTLAGALATAALSASTAFAQGAADAYPARPVTIVIPYGPGGSTDLEARLYTQKLTESLRQPFLIDYKPGAGATIGTAFVARAVPDGYTLLMHTATFSIAPATYGDKSPYDAIKDFAPVSLTTMTPDILVVTASLPVNNVREYIAYAKANPGRLNFGTSGMGGINHISGAWLHSTTNTAVTFVHYKGGNDIMRTLVSGEIQSVVAPPLIVLPHVKSGKVRALAVTTADRVSFLPDLPSLQEEGVPNCDWANWVAAFAPARTPAAIVNKLGAEFSRIVKLPDIVQKLGQGKVMVGSTPEELRKLVAREVPAWKKIVLENGIKSGD